ncbi:MAG: PEP-CTERM sorting domain-containing protein [Verrucomicrobia bacterium]|nr:PEP-CTERM sorting domain-containing protein [Verrucomicrobiota bacterium]MCH8511001.1 PEP-CTERM sorting domain-containing protein [Kiritimatiellia bacterium]
MNYKQRTLLLGAVFLGATASAAIVFQDDFSTGTAADAGYFHFGTTGSNLATDNSGGTLDYAYTSSAANRSGVYKTFSGQTLAVGEILTLSFSIDGRTLRSGENHAFRWAIGNLGDPSAITVSGGGPFGSDLDSATPLDGGTREMYQFSASTGATNGFGQYVTGSSSPVHNAGGSATAITSFSGPASIGTTGDATVVLSITRTATGFEFDQTAFGSSTSGTLVGGTDFFNALAFSMNNAGDYDFSLSDVTVSVIPEPSTLLLLGISLISALALRRRNA